MVPQMNQPTFWILTVLVGRRRHGYEIMRETMTASGDRVLLKPTTLYAALERLERNNLIATDGEEIVNGRARRYYRILDEGTALLTAEVELLERSSKAARSRLTTVRSTSVLTRPAVA